MALNRAQQHSGRWKADLLLKLVRWRATVAAFHDEPFLIANRSGSSAIAYSAATLAEPGVVDEFVSALTAVPLGHWVPILLACEPAVAVGRARQRAAQAGHLLRQVDQPGFIATVNQAFDRLGHHLPLVHVEADNERHRVHATIVHQLSCGNAAPVMTLNAKAPPADGRESRPVPGPPATRTVADPQTGP